jgi:hypothetical protein
MPQETLDLTKMFGRATIAIDPEETPEEHTARIKKEQREATFDIVKSYVLFFVIVAAIIFIGGLCAYESVFDASATPDTKRSAWTMLSALFTGSVSFVLGQMSVRKSK